MKRLPDDPRFKHVNLYHTDLKATFRRIERERREAEAKRIADDEARKAAVVQPINRATRKP